MAKKFDIKQLMLERGEKIGVGIAAVVALASLVLFLFMPGKGFFSGSSEDKAKALKDKTQLVNNKLNDKSNVPGDQHKPPADSDKKLIAFNFPRIEGGDYRLASLIPATGATELGRLMPEVLPIEEGVAQAKHIRVRSYIFSNNGESLYALTKETDEGSGKPKGEDMRKGKKKKKKGNFGATSGLFPGRKGGAPPSPMGGGYTGVPGQLKGNTETKKKDKTVVFLPLTAKEKIAAANLAETVRPVRMVVIAASFPFKKQIEEFQNKLGLTSVDRVLRDSSEEKDGKTKKVLPAFRFIGVNVQRREIAADGTAGKWDKVDLFKDYRQYIVLTGQRFEEDDPKFDPISFDGLVMPRVMAFRDDSSKTSSGTTPMGGGPPPTPGGKKPPTPMGGFPGMGDDDKPEKKEPAEDDYPKPEADLKKLQATLEALKGKTAAQVATPASQFRADDFPIFSKRGGVTEGSAGGDDSPTAKPRDPDDKTNPEDKDKDQPTLPDHCLVRVIDVTVQPGKTYEYRLQIVMANPNKNRKTGIASPTYATISELKSPWSQVPIRVTLKPELYYYAVDQQKLEDRTYKGPYTSRRLLPGEVVVQAHRWIDVTKLDNGTPLLVGEWSVAERMPVFRGEYVGRQERVEVPYWRYSREAFVLARDGNTTKKRPGITVSFGYNDPSDQPEAILLDATETDFSYERVVSKSEEKTDTRKVSDKAQSDVLLLNTDGNLILLEGAKDINDPVRVKRLEKVRNRIKDLKDDSGKGTGTKGGGKNPFSD